jgi:hypothetical protein
MNTENPSLFSPLISFNNTPNGKKSKINLEKKIYQPSSSNRELNRPSPKNGDLENNSVAEDRAIKIVDADASGLLLTDCALRKKLFNTNYIIEEKLKREEDNSGTVNPSQEDKIDSCDLSPTGQGVQGFREGRDKKGYTKFSNSKNLQIFTDVLEPQCTAFEHKFNKEHNFLSQKNREGGNSGGFVGRSDGGLTGEGGSNPIANESEENFGAYGENSKDLPMVLPKNIKDKLRDAEHRRRNAENHSGSQKKVPLPTPRKGSGRLVNNLAVKAKIGSPEN